MGVSTQSTIDGREMAFLDKLQADWKKQLRATLVIGGLMVFMFAARGIRGELEVSLWMLFMAGVMKYFETVRSYRRIRGLCVMAMIHVLSFIWIVRVILVEAHRPNAFFRLLVLVVAGAICLGVVASVAWRAYEDLSK